jgi:hypothetical protein
VRISSAGLVQMNGWDRAAMQDLGSPHAAALGERQQHVDRRSRSPGTEGLVLQHACELHLRAIRARFPSAAKNVGEQCAREPLARIDAAAEETSAGRALTAARRGRLPPTLPIERYARSSGNVRSTPTERSPENALQVAERSSPGQSNVSLGHGVVIGVSRGRGRRLRCGWLSWSWRGTVLRAI